MASSNTTEYGQARPEDRKLGGSTPPLATLINADRVLRAMRSERKDCHELLTGEGFLNML